MEVQNRDIRHLKAIFVIKTFAKGLKGNLKTSLSRLKTSYVPILTSVLSENSLTVILIITNIFNFITHYNMLYIFCLNYKENNYKKFIFK